MTDTPSPNLTSPEDVFVDPRNNCAASSDHLGSIAPRRSSKQTHLKGIPMDGGDAPLPGDCPGNHDHSETSKRPLSAEIGEYIIDETDAPESKARIQDEAGSSLVEIKGQYKEPDFGYLQEAEKELRLLDEEEKEIEDLVRFVLQKAKIDLMEEELADCPSPLVDEEPPVAFLQDSNSSACETVSPEHSHRPSEDTLPETDERARVGGGIPPQCHRQEQQEMNHPDEDKEWKGTVFHEEAEQELDALIRSVIEKAERDWVQVGSSCIPEKLEVEEQASDANKETGLDFGFHSVMSRLTACDESWGGMDCMGVGMIKKGILHEGEEELEVETSRESVGEQQEASGDMGQAEEATTEEPVRGNIKVIYSLPSCGSEKVGQLDTLQEVHNEMQKEETNEVQGSTKAVEDSDPIHGSDLVAAAEALNKVQDAVQGEVTKQEARGSRDEVTFPLAQGEATKELRDNEDSVNDDKILADEQEDEVTSEEEDFDLLTSEEEDELDSMVGFVIDAARSSLVNNFDVFTFNKSVDSNDSIGPTGENEKIAAEDQTADENVGERDSAENAEKITLYSSHDKGSTVSKIVVIDAATAVGDHNRQDFDRAGEDVGDADDGSVNGQNTGYVDFKKSGTPVDTDEKEDSELPGSEASENGAGHISGTVVDRELRKVGETSAADTTGRESTHQPLGKGCLQPSEEHQCVASANGDEEKQPSLTNTGKSLQPPLERTTHVTADVQSQEAIDGISCVPIDDSSNERNTSDPDSPDLKGCMIGSHLPLIVNDVASDSDDDDDDDNICGSKCKSTDGTNATENDWECLAIQQISQSLYGEPFHHWLPTYNTTHLGVTDALRKHQENASKRLDTDESEIAKTNERPPSEKEAPPKSSRELDSADIAHAHNPSSSHKPTTKPSASIPDSSQSSESLSRPAEINNGMALINDGLRKKIVLLEKRLQQLALELTFLGDRNWRLEAYVDCLIKTLEELEVTDVVDLDQKTLPLCLFKVKVKAGYKLGSYNGIPSRSLWSYTKEGRPPPFVDLRGWGNTDKPAKRPDPIDPTPLPSCDDDVGLSASQMYQYESQLEELSVQNQILEAQLRETNERVQAVTGGNDEGEAGNQVDPLAMQQQQQQYADQMMQNDQHGNLPQDLQVLKQQLQGLQESHQEEEECWKQPYQEQHQYQQQQSQPIFPTSMQKSQPPPECLLHEENQYSLPSVQQQIPPMQQQQQLPPPQQQQRMHHYQFQQYQSQSQPQQQMLQQQQQQGQAWNPEVVQEETVLPGLCEWECGEELSLQDPQEWPSLTESQAKDASHPQTRPSTQEEHPHQPWLPKQSSANEAVSYVSRSTSTVSSDPTKDMSTLHSSMAQPASTGSISSRGNRYRAPHHLENKLQDKTSSSASCQSFRKNRRFETNRGPAPYNRRPLEQSRSGIDFGPRGRRQEESTRKYGHWNSPINQNDLSFLGEFLSSDVGETCYPDRSHVRTTPSYHPPYPRNSDRNQRFLSGDSVLDSYRPDVLDFQQDAAFGKDLSGCISASGPTFELSSVNDFNRFPGPPSTRGFSAASVGGLPYRRQHDARPATPRRGKPWIRAGLPRHSSYTSPRKYRANTDLTFCDSK